MTKARVFVVQRPTRRDPATGEIIPSMDLGPAAQFGELRFVLREFENPLTDLSATAREVDAYLEAEGFCEDDLLLLVGNPVLIATVSAVAALHVERMRVLLWNRFKRHYTPLDLQLPQGAPQLERA